MPATVTLSTTTLTYGIDPGAGEIQLDSVSGILPGYRLWIDRELMSVLRLIPGSERLQVQRGVDGTAAAEHSSSATVTIGTPDQFYSRDPVGAPSSAIPVSPWINVLNGKVWYAQGDSVPDGQTYRWWQEVSQTYGIGALGVRTQTSAPTSST